MSTWPQLTGNSNVFRQSYVSGFLDVSGSTTVRQDLTIMGRLVVPTTVNNTIISNYSLIVAEDISLNGRMYIGNGAGVNFLQGNDYMLDISGTSNQTGTVRIFEDKGTLPTATTGSLIIQHNDVSGVSSILFPSKSALGLDYASIAYYESISGGLSGGSKYNYYGDVSSTTSSALVFNVQRDAFNATDVSSIDSIILQATGSIILDACASILGQTVIQPRGGNVGIGKTFPQYPLDIHGAVNMSALSLNDGSVQLSSQPQMDFSNNFATTWKAVGTSMPGSALQLNGIFLSATGQYQTAVIGNTLAGTTGSIYTSSNYGITWNQSTQAAANWAGIAISGNGQIQTAIVGGTGGITSGSIYVSTNYGNTWTARGTSQPWSGIAMSANGIFQTAVINGGSIYTSANSGTTWTISASISQSWYCNAMSANGKFQLAGIGGATATGTLYVSSDYGFSWVNINTGTTPGLINCHAVEVSATGQYMTALAFGGSIYTSSDYGVTWVRNTSAPTNINWHGVTMSSNGQYQVAVNNNSGYIYYSINFGSTWVQTATAQAWRTVSMSADAKYITACVVGGSLYSSITPFPYLSSSNNLDVTGNLNIINPTNSTYTGSLYMNGAVITTGNTLSITSVADSTSTATGALQVTGGVGIGGNLTVGGPTLSITSTTASTSTATGALKVTGGVGISGNLNIGGSYSIFNTKMIIGSSNDGISSTISDSTYATTSMCFVGQGTSPNRLITMWDKVTVNGTVTATSFSAQSDYRLKTNIQPLSEKRIIDNLKPIEYDLSGGGHDMGFLAHEIQEEFPFLVTSVKDGETLQTLNYIGLISLLVKEVQVLKKNNTELQSKLDILTQRLDNAGL
jgi:hypothetical protein